MVKSRCGLKAKEDIEENTYKGRSKKGKMNTVDLAPAIKSFSVEGETVTLLLSAGGANNLNPKLLLEAFEKQSGEKLPYASVLRTMIYDQSGEEFV